MRPALLALVSVVLAAPAFATDGVFEINQTCAANTGCFPGDTAGFPVTVTTPGKSYRLTSPLIVPGEYTDAINISAPSVTVDLNGFEIVRDACEGLTTICPPAASTASGAGVDGFFPGITVKNGTISGMGRIGVVLGDQAEVTNLRVRWNRLAGIHVSSGSIVSGNSSFQNGGDGIYAFSGSVISGNSVYDNGLRGIFAASTGSVVSGNAVHGNGGDGIYITSAATAFGNTSYSNGGYGIYVGTTSSYRGNTIDDNTLGAVTGGVDAGGNVCDGSLTCP